MSSHVHFLPLIPTPSRQAHQGSRGEGSALAEKGALAKAREKLALVEKACGKADCAAADALTTAIARGPRTVVKTAEVVLPEAD